MSNPVPRLVIDEVLDHGDVCAGTPAVYALRIEPIARLTVRVWPLLRRAARRSIERAAASYPVAIRVDDGQLDTLIVHAWADDPADAVRFLRDLRRWAGRED